MPVADAVAATFTFTREGVAGSCTFLRPITQHRLDCVRSIGALSAGTGLLNGSPCTSWHPSRARQCSCSSVSTPSAVVVMPRLRLRPVTARTIATEPPSLDRPFTKLRSILILSNGRLADTQRRVPCPESSMEIAPHLPQPMQRHQVRIVLLKEHALGDFQLEAAIVPSPRRSGPD